MQSVHVCMAFLGKRYVFQGHVALTLAEVSHLILFQKKGHRRGGTKTTRDTTRVFSNSAGSVEWTDVRLAAFRVSPRVLASAVKFSSVKPLTKCFVLGFFC